MSEKQSPPYEVGRDFEEYEAILPKFNRMGVKLIIDQLVAGGNDVAIADLGAGSFNFTESCALNPSWREALNITGITLDNFISDARLSRLTSLGVSCLFVSTTHAALDLHEQFDLVVSVFTDIHDPETNYPAAAWQMLRHGGIALIDNMRGQGSTVMWQQLEQILREKGYEVEIQRQTVAKEIPTRNVYQIELDRLRRELPDWKPQAPDATRGASIAFKKNDSLPNIGNEIDTILSVLRE